MEIFVSLSITSREMTADEIVANIGMAGDRLWGVGDIRMGTSIKESRNGWKIESHREMCDDIEPAIQSLLDRTIGYEKKFDFLGDRCEALVRCVIYSKETPALYVHADLIKRISLLNASLDFDLFLI